MRTKETIEIPRSNKVHEIRRVDLRNSIRSALLFNQNSNSGVASAYGKSIELSKFPIWNQERINMQRVLIP